MTADQLKGVIDLVVSAEKAGVVLVKDIIDFFESKGADETQIAANRVLLITDIADIEHELGPGSTSQGG